MISEYEQRKTWKHTKRHLKKSHRVFRDMLDRRLDQLKPSEKDASRMRALMGDGPMNGQIRASDLSAHLRYALYIAKEVRELARVSDHLRFYHITLLADEGFMSERTPKFMKRKLVSRANRAMAKAGLDGIYVIENQVRTGYPAGGKGKSILAHVHILAWKPLDAPDSAAADVRDAITSSKRRRNYGWTSRLGAPPVVVKEITPAMGCPSYWIAYLMKMPKDAKNLMPRKPKETGSVGAPKAKLRNTFKGYRREAAMRLYELSAQMPLSSTAHGRGAGVTMIQRAKVRLRLWDVKRQVVWRDEGAPGVEPFDERAFWTRMRGKRRSKFKPFVIDGPTIADGSTRKRV